MNRGAILLPQLKRLRVNVGVALAGRRTESLVLDAAAFPSLRMKGCAQQTDTPVALDEDRLAWLALTLTPGLGPRRILEAMRRLDAPWQIFSLELMALEGLRFPAAAAQYIFDGKARAGAEQ